MQNKHLCVLIHIRNNGEVGTVKHVKPSSGFLTERSKAWLFCGSFWLYVFRVCHCHTVLSVLCTLVVTCCEMADLLTLLCVNFFFAILSLSHVVSWVSCGT